MLRGNQCKSHGRHDTNAIYLRLSLTSRCNLRCKYCRPDQGTDESYPPCPLTADELIELVGTIHEVNPVYKLRFTGGEPLLRSGLPELIGRFKHLLPDTELCLTTNGTLLEGRSLELKKAGLRSMNISLDTLDESRFQALTGRAMLPSVLEGILDASRVGFEKLKLNTVLLRSINGDQLPALIRSAAAHKAEIRFVELMPFGAGAGLFPDEYYSADEALDRIKTSFGYLRSAASSATAKRHVIDVDGNEVTIGFITSISSRFCDGCDRIRLDSFGRMFACMRDEGGIDLGPGLRGRDFGWLRERIQRTLRGKKASDTCWPARSMVQLGG
jgi:cyclic pyranopterin phosphate synthase